VIRRVGSQRYDGQIFNLSFNQGSLQSFVGNFFLFLFSSFMKVLCVLE